MKESVIKRIKIIKKKQKTEVATYQKFLTIEKIRKLNIIEY